MTYNVFGGTLKPCLINQSSHFYFTLVMWSETSGLMAAQGLGFAVLQINYSSHVIPAVKTSLAATFW